MVHVNSTNPGSAYMLGVMAHEFQHLIHYVADPDEDSWINEAMSELAMSVSGYEDTGNLHAYDSQTGQPLWVHNLGTVGNFFYSYNPLFSERFVGPAWPDRRTGQARPVRPGPRRSRRPRRCSDTRSARRAASWR